MSDLRLVAVDEQGEHLVLRRVGDEPAPDQGGVLRLPIDDRLRAALKADRLRLGQLQIEIESQLRPREIQARIRAGESVDSVARAAGVDAERVMRYAAPVLAERAHVADQARRLPVRRPGVGADLHDAVTERAAGDGGGDVRWDAWRREDARWSVRATWDAAETTHCALWTFDPAVRSLTPDDDTAQAIGGEPSAAGVTGRLAVVRDADLAEALELANDRQPVVELDHTATQPIPLAPPAPADAGAELQRPAPPRRSPNRRRRRVPDERLRLSDIASVVEEEVAAEAAVEERPDLDEPAAPHGPTDSPGGIPASSQAGRGRRPTVPSWDEIMFGRRRQGGE